MVNLLSVVKNVEYLLHLDARSSFTYSGIGQVLTATDPLGTVTLNVYDPKGNLIEVTRDTGRLNQITRMDYDALGNPIALTDPKGNVTRTVYDANRRVTSIVAPKSAASTDALTTSFGYDPDGRVRETVTGAGTLTITTGATYTPSGKVASTTDAKGNVTRSAYDVLDRVASITDALGRVTRYKRRAEPAHGRVQLGDPSPGAAGSELHPRRPVGEPHRRQRQHDGLHLRRLRPAKHDDLSGQQHRRPDL